MDTDELSKQIAFLRNLHEKLMRRLRFFRLHLTSRDEYIDLVLEEMNNDIQTLENQITILEQKISQSTEFIQTTLALKQVTEQPLLVSQNEVSKAFFLLQRIFTDHFGPRQENKSLMSVVKQKLSNHFSTDELKNLCQDLSIDYEDFPTDNKSAMVREMVAYLERRNQLTILISKISLLRPEIDMRDLQ